jgi:hypothetical protein
MLGLKRFYLTTTGLAFIRSIAVLIHCGLCPPGFGASLSIVDCQSSGDGDGTHASDVIEAPVYRDGIPKINWLR